MLSNVIEFSGEPEPYRIIVFRPEGAVATQPLPTVIFLQAGEWVPGSVVDDLEPLAKQLTARGFVLVALPRPTRNDVPFAVLTEECAARVSGLLSQCGELGIDSGRLYLAGFGPGAVLSVCLATQPALLKAAGMRPGALRGVIAISGLYDFSAVSMHAPLNEWLGVGETETPAELRCRSPFFHAASGAIGPPLLLVFAQSEPFLLDEHAKRLYGLLLRRKWPVRLTLVPGARHCDLLTSIGARRTIRAFGAGDIAGTYPDLLGPSITTFVEEVDSGVFGHMFGAAWPPGWPTGGFSPDYTLSEALPPLGVRWHRDIPYVEEGDALQYLDVQEPGKPSDTLRPVFFYVHGGGWRAGSKRMVHGLAELAAAQNMVFVSVDYRLAPAFKMSDLAADVASALLWVRRNIDRYGGDSQKLVLVGVSAGAHLVTLLATDPDLRSRFASSSVSGVIAISGIYDLDDFAEPGVLPSRVEQAMAEPGSRALRRHSPALLAASGTPLPPVLITFTDADLPYLDQQAVQLFDRWSEAGADCRLRAIPDRDHFNQTVGIGRSVGLYDDMLGPAIVEFLYRINLLPVPGPARQQ